MKLFCLAS